MMIIEKTKKVRICDNYNKENVKYGYERKYKCYICGCDLCKECVEKHSFEENEFIHFCDECKETYCDVIMLYINMIKYKEMEIQKQTDAFYLRLSNFRNEYDVKIREQLKMLPCFNGDEYY